MAHLFKRISDVIAANLNDLVDRVEDPERMIKQLIREMEENISNAREGVDTQLRAKSNLPRNWIASAGKPRNGISAPGWRWSPATKPWPGKR